MLINFSKTNISVIAGLMLCVPLGLRADEVPVAERTSGPAEKENVAREVRQFDVLEYRVTGNTVLPANVIEESVYPWMGKNKSVDDVEGARTALEKAYHKAGYLTVLVDIPEQDVRNGVVHLNVTEGRVERLRVSGSRYYSLGRIKAQSPALAEGEIPRFPDVQKNIALLNRTADKRVTPVMKAGKKFGTVDVDLKVEDSLPLHASLELNDRYSRDTERWRLAGMVRYDNLWQREHSLSLQFQTAPQNTDQAKVFSASYLYRFDDSDLMLAFYGVRSTSNVSSVGGINVLGNGTILGARAIVPLPSLENYFHSISLGGDYKSFEEDILFGSDTASTPISYMPFAIQYSGTVQHSRSTSQVGLGVNFGFRGLVGADNEFDTKRAGARSDFFMVKPEIQHTQTLAWDMQLWGKLDGQVAGGPLISNEQFAAGGVDSVRGYLESEAMGDHGLHASLELRSPALKRGAWLQELRLLGFYDIAELRTLDAVAPEPEQRKLASMGFGVRIQLWQRWNASLAFARPLEDAESTVRGDINKHMRFWYEI